MDSNSPWQRILAWSIVSALSLTIFGAASLILFSGKNGDDSPRVSLRQAVVPIAEAKEITSERTLTSKTYDTGNGMRKLITRAEPMHYPDSDGVLQEIQTALAPSDNPKYAFQVERGLYKTYFPGKYETSADMRFVSQGYDFTLFPRSLEIFGNEEVEPLRSLSPDSSAGKVKNNVMRYDDAYGSETAVLLSYEAGALHRELILDSLTSIEPYLPDDAQTLEFGFSVLLPKGVEIQIGQSVWKGAEAVTEKELRFVEQKSGKVIFSLPRPVAIDANGDSTALSFRLKRTANGGIYISKQIPVSWLRQAIYPVKADDLLTVFPTDGGMSVLTGSDYTTIHNTTDGTSDSITGTLELTGNYYFANFGIYRSRLYFDTSALGIGAKVATATIYMRGGSLGVVTGTAHYLNVYDWTGSTGSALSNYNKNLFGSTVLGTIISTSFVTSTVFNQIVLTNTSTVSTTGNTFFGFRTDREVAATAPGKDERFGYYTENYTGTDRDPYLEVSFTPNSAPTTTAITGVQSSASMVTVTTTITDTADLEATSIIAEYSRDNTTWVSSTLGHVTVSEGSITTSTGQIASIDTNTDGSVDVTLQWNAGTDIPAIEDTSVYFRVTPNDGYRSGAQVASAAFTVDTGAATAPGSMTSSTVATTSMAISFGSAGSDTNFVEYKAYYKAGSGVTESDTALTSSTIAAFAQTNYASSTSFTISSLTPNTAYSAKLYMYDSYRNSTSTSEISFTTLSATPTAFAISVDSDTQMTTSWNANNNPSGTEYYVENTNGGTNSGWVTSTSAVFTALKCGAQTYAFRIQARNSSSVETGYADTVTARTANCPSGVEERVIFQPRRPEVDAFAGISVEINDGDDTAATGVVNIRLNGGASPLRMKISERADFLGASEELFAERRTFAFSFGDGEKTVYAKFYAADGRESSVVSDSITLIPAVVSVPPPIVEMPSEDAIIKRLPFVVTGFVESLSLARVHIAGTGYRVTADFSGRFSVTVLDQLVPGDYKIFVTQAYADGAVSLPVERKIRYNPPVINKTVEKAVEEPMPRKQEDLPLEQSDESEVTIEVKIPDRGNVGAPVGNNSPRSASGGGATPSLAEAPLVNLPSPTQEEVQEIITEVTENREAYLLVFADETASFTRQQINGIEAVQGESLTVLIRPAEEIKSITGRLYRVDDGLSPGQPVSAEPLTFWRRVRKFFSPARVLAAERAQDGWIAGYYFSPQAGTAAFEQTIDIPRDLPAGMYELVVTVNRLDGTREEVIKKIKTLPEGIVKNLTGRAVKTARVSVYRQNKDENYELWEGSPFGEQNPFKVRANGSYAIHVPTGRYYIVVDAPLHDTYKSGIILMDRPGIVHDDITLENNGPDLWYRFISWLVELFQREDGNS